MKPIALLLVALAATLTAYPRAPQRIRVRRRAFVTREGAMFAYWMSRP